MRSVVFYHSGEVHPFVHKMVASVKANFDLPLIQMTDLETDAIKGCDEVIRKDHGVGMAASRIYSMRDYEHEECLMLDNDLIVKKNVEGVFDKPFDVAVTLRGSAEPGGQAKLNQGQPYNSGVVFSRSPLFWERCAEWCADRSENVQRWGAEQRSINWVALNDEEFDVLELPCAKYNWSPNPKMMENDDAYIWHYKGDRKRWM